MLARRTPCVCWCSSFTPPPNLPLPSPAGDFLRLAASGLVVEFIYKERFLMHMCMYIHTVLKLVAALRLALANDLLSTT